MKKNIAIVLSLCIISVGYALFEEHRLHLVACPLCMAERLMLMAIAIFAFIYTLASYLGTYHTISKVLCKVLFVLIILCALLGLYLSCMHIKIMLSHASSVSSCEAPLGVLYQNLPLMSFLNVVLHSGVSCSTITWTIFGLIPPIPVAILFVLILFLCLFA